MKARASARTFFSVLTALGLTGVKLLTSDVQQGLVAAIQASQPAPSSAVVTCRPKDFPVAVGLDASRDQVNAGPCSLANAAVPTRPPTR